MNMEDETKANRMMDETRSKKNRLREANLSQ